jgi:hypothetical protein
LTPGLRSRVRRGQHSPLEPKLPGAEEPGGLVSPLPAAAIARTARSPGLEVPVPSGPPRLTAHALIGRTRENEIAFPEQEV